MKVVSVIGTHQHYEDPVSKALIDDLRLEIDVTLETSAKFNETEFIANCILQLGVHADLYSAPKFLNEHPEIQNLFGKPKHLMMRS